MCAGIGTRLGCELDAPEPDTVESAEVGASQLAELTDSQDADASQFRGFASVSAKSWSGAGALVLSVSTG
jgi:hypothetical protein